MAKKTEMTKVDVLKDVLNEITKSLEAVKKDVDVLTKNSKRKDGFVCYRPGGGSRTPFSARKGK